LDRVSTEVAGVVVGLVAVVAVGVVVPLGVVVPRTGVVNRSNINNALTTAILLCMFYVYIRDDRQVATECTA